MDTNDLENINRLAMTDDIPEDQIMEMARHVDSVLMASRHEIIQTRWRVRILVAGVLDAANAMEGVDAVVLDFTNSGPGWSLKNSMQVITTEGQDAAKIAKKFEKATGAIRSRLGFSRDVYFSLALQFSYSRVEINPRAAEVWLALAAKGERINPETIARAAQQVMEVATAQAGPGKALPRM